MAALKAGADKSRRARSLTSSTSGSLLNGNAWKCTRALEKSQEIRCLSLDGEESKRIARLAEGAEDHVGYRYGSHATTFANKGIQPGHGLKDKYVRDPLSGAWFRDDKARQRRAFGQSGSPMVLKYHDEHAATSNGVSMFVISSDRGHSGNLWFAPSGGTSGKMRKSSSSGIVGRTTTL